MEAGAFLETDALPEMGAQPSLVYVVLVHRAR